MRWTSAAAIYILFWSLAVFLVLPFGVRTTREVGGELIPGQAESAPHEFRAGRTMLRVTIVATAMFGLFLLNYRYGWVSTAMFNFSGAAPNSFD